ncbi:MAG: hypothetical protein Ct9H300mP16_15020 [Pseudomonadota bacterium]|nr:MAG: hypothetical protein Ct9H300mP16_15020 [Pseudomonadota bacterium]
MTFSSAHVAETAFYDAFQSADLEAMMRVWHPDEAVCIHPFGRRIEGHDAVAGAGVRFSPNRRHCVSRSAIPGALKATALRSICSSRTLR